MLDLTQFFQVPARDAGSPSDLPTHRRRSRITCGNQYFVLDMI